VSIKGWGGGITEDDYINFINNNKNYLNLH
jgi:hypothetical protein